MKHRMKKIISMMLVFVMILSCFNTISFESKASENKGYKELTYSDITREQLQGVSALDKTAFTVKASFKDGGYFRIGGNNNGNGWTDTLAVSYINNINQSGNKAIYFSWIKGTASAGVSTNSDAVYPSNVAVEQDMLLRLTFDVDGDNLIINTYVNGVWYKESTIKAVAPYMGTRIVWSNVTLKSVKTDYKELTYSDITREQLQGVSTLDKTAFTVKASFKDGGYFRIGGNNNGNGWTDTLAVSYIDNINNSGNKAIYFSWIKGTASTSVSTNTDAVYPSNVAVGQEMLLRLTFDVDGDNLIINTYVNGVWYKESTIKAVAPYMGTRIVWSNVVMKSVVIASNVQEPGGNEGGSGSEGSGNEGGGNEGGEPQPEPQPIEQKTPEQLGYTQVRLRDFMLADGTYSPQHKNGNHHFDTCDIVSLSNTYLDVNMSFKEPATIEFDNSLRFASTAGWKGIQIGLSGGELKICNAADRKGESYSKEELGLDEGFEKTFNLKLGIQIGEDKGDGTCDITYDLWIKNVRVVAEAVLASVNIADIGTGLGIYTPSGTMILTSPESAKGDENATREELPSSFRKVTYHSFGINDGTYNYNAGKLSYYGDYALSLNKTIFSGDVYYSHTKGGDFRYGGKTNEWCGIWFYSRSDGKLYMRGVEGDTGTYVFNSVVAGTELTDNWFNIKLSTEYVDSDGDGAKDDVKLGVWFNDVLYDNTYIYLKDYVQYLGNYMSIFVDNENSFIALKNDKSIDRGIDFTLFGCTKNWAKEIGL